MLSSSLQGRVELCARHDKSDADFGASQRRYLDMSSTYRRPASSSSAEPLLVRLGIGYFQRRSRSAQPAEAIDAVHLLNPDEREALRKIERGAIVRAAIAGGLSTVIAGVV